MVAQQTHTFDEVLNALPSDSYDRGQAFENLCAWYLRHSPEYQRQISKVEKPRGQDIGVDLVAETHDGKRWAIQCKAYDKSYQIKKADIDSFLSASASSEFSFRLLIATTNKIGKNAERTLNLQEKPVGRLLYSDLRRSQVDWGVWKDSNKSSAQQRKSPRAVDQAQAVKDVVAGLKVHDRGQLIMACGTGKTLVAMWAFDQLKPQRTLVLTPSLSLISQIIREWTPNTSSEFNYLPVCSDPTVDRRTGARSSDDSIISSLSELGYPANPDPEEISTFLKSSGQHVIFSTYHSSPKVSDAMKLSGLKFNLVIADEAHHCAGDVNSDFATVLDDELIKADKRLFMTATPRIFTGRVIKAARDKDFEIASMDDHSKFGPVFHELNFGEAIEKGVLSDYQVLVIGVSDPEIEEQVKKGILLKFQDATKPTDARSLGALIGLLRAVKKHDITKTISFHQTIDRAKRFASVLSKTSVALSNEKSIATDVWAEYVSGKMTSGDRVDMLEAFEAASGQPAILSNAKCLGEGVDVPSIDGVAFIDPKRSQIDIVQAVGRAIRKSGQDKTGTIILPVFINPEDDPQAIVEQSDFKDVWAVVSALRDHDKQFAEEIDALRFGLGYAGSLVGKRPEKLILDLPDGITADFVNAFDTRLVEMTSSSFEFGLGVLQRFVEREGNARVPQDHVENGFHLGGWARDRRNEYTKGTLSLERIKAFKEFPGWTWDLYEYDFQEGLAALKTFAQREGTVKMPRNQQEGNVRLGNWIGSRRNEYNTGALSSERIKVFKDVPYWTWDPYETEFEEGLAALKTFAEREGHISVPTSHIEGNVRLQRWTTSRRREYRKGALSSDRIKAFKEVPGWVWDPFEAEFEEGLAALKAYAKREGHISVPSSHIEGNVRLQRWIAKRRGEYKKRTINAVRIKGLKEVPGWVWDPFNAEFEDGLAALKAFAEREGHISVPSSHREGTVRLQSWTMSRRGDYKKGILSPEKIRAIKEVPGWAWDPREAYFQMCMVALKTFAEREGHTKMPRKYSEGDVKLGGWVVNRRQDYRMGKLTPERIKAFEEIPAWVWR